MIKQGILNFFKNLKYFFTPLGTLALGLVIGLSVFLPGVLTALSDLFRNVQTILEGTTVDFSALKESVLTAVGSLGWENGILSAIRTMVSEEWLTATLNGFVGAFVEDVSIYAVKFQEAIGAFKHEIVLSLLAMAAFTVLGMVSGYFLTRWLIRRNMMMKLTVGTFLLHALADSLLTVLIAGVSAWLAMLWKPSLPISGILSVFVFGSVSLFEAYLIHGRKRIPLKEILNTKNILKLYATNFIIFLLSAALTAAVVFLINALVGIFVGIAIMEIGFIVIGLNAESYVMGVAERAQKSPQGAKIC